jgi:hypothetical protein
MNDQGKSSKCSAEEPFIIVGIISLVTAMLVLVCMSIFTSEQMFIIRPIIVSCAVFVAFSYILWIRTRVHLFGEIGFIYITLALAYTLSPAIKFLMLDFNLPFDFDGLNFAVLSPQPAEMGSHFWRHVIFISGVSAGFLVVRGGPQQFMSLKEKSIPNCGRAIAIMILIMGCCALVVSLLVPSVTTYIEHYTRFDNLSSPVRKLVELCSIFKNGGYFVIMALLFSQYNRYRKLIYIMVPMVCTYEVVFSLGSRIVAFTILMAALGFYHFRVRPITLKKSLILLIVLAIIFSLIGLIRHYNYSLEDAEYNIIKQNDILAMEFESVYCTGFHLYFEREKGTLPFKDWQMFFNDFISIIPFVDHIKYNPQYWYSRNYFPAADVPPTTIGVLADSAIWGGECDLLARSLINGALFALLTRWFFSRREKWWALTIYIYCFATCIMTLKYSILFQLSPLFRILLPPLLLSEVIIRLQRTSGFFKKMSTEPVI